MAKTTLEALECSDENNFFTPFRVIDVRRDVPTVHKVADQLPVRAPHVVQRMRHGPEDHAAHDAHDGQQIVLP